MENGLLANANANRFAIAAALTLSAVAIGAEPTGDVAALQRIDALQREAQELFPYGRLEATLRTDRFWPRRASLEAEVVGYWDEGGSRIEARIVEERPDFEGKPEREESDLTLVIRGTEFLRFRDSRRIVFLDDFGDRAFCDERTFDYLACLPRDCWFGGGRAVSRPWSFYFEPYVPKEGYDRTTHVETEGDLVRIRHGWTRNGAEVSSRSGTFDLGLAGMCVAFERSSSFGDFSGTLEWTRDRQGRPVLQAYNWSERQRGVESMRSQLTIRSFDPESFVDERKFSTDLAQFPGVQVVDQRTKPWRIQWMPLEPASGEEP